MSSDTKTSAGDTVRMSSSVPQNDKSNKRSDDYDPAYDPTIADADLTAQQYLTRQAERAKAAMMGTAGIIKQTAVAKVKGVAPGHNGAHAGPSDTAGAGSNGDSGPMKILKQHPWYAVGGATAVGFLSAIYFNPSRFGRLKSRIKKLEKRLKEQEENLSDSPKSGSDSKAETAAKSSIFSSIGTLIVSQGMQALKPFLQQYVGPLMAGRNPEQGNGYPPHEYEGYEGYDDPEPGPQPASPAARAAADERFGGHPPPRSAGDPSI